MDEIQSLLEELRGRVSDLEKKRIFQQDVIPDAIKMRHIGEGVRYIQTGTAANRPTTPAVPPGSCMLYFETDTNKLYIWNTATSGGGWKSVTLS